MGARMPATHLEKVVVFFPTPACRDATGNWQIPVHGWVYRPMEVSHLRRAGLKVARAWIKLRYGPSDETLATFTDRFGAFLQDNERGERMKVFIGGREFGLRKSSPSGH